ncbi:hypothetical protein EJ04DRAFT_538163 [Polyplosphaeria fusca]|uniref:Rhodopsin domain-containing protein n=1 Tax=Polyplosphaeria fusca TaxID=682080 RepID=A0A9P4QP13_9PLEO|nr:hypothetical protein EJ04DRAFT_538163 [Polyplosphaeria fusca]
MAGQGLQPALIALLYLFPALALGIIIVRLWRKQIDRTLGGDVVETFAGYHPQDVPREKIDMIYANKLQYALGVEYNPVICVIKASFMWSLQRLRSGNVWIRRSLWALQILNAVYCVATTLVSIFPCRPLKARFDFSLPGDCYDSFTYVVGNVSVVIVTDFLVLLIPTWIIYDLHMPLRRKLMTISFLSLGVIVIVIGILRLIWLTNAFRGKINNYSVESAYSSIESSVAIIGTCGPTIKYILGRFIPGLRPQSETTKPSKYGQSGYANGSSQGASRKPRSRQHSNPYGDLDEVSLEREEIEMKNNNNWRWKQDSDAHSDEQRITSESNEGIVKTVDWTVSSRSESLIGTPGLKSANSESPSVMQPTHIV